MIVEQFRTGGDRNFGYLVADKPGGKALAIDVSGGAREIFDEAKRRSLELHYLFSTHGHADHTCGNDLMARLTGLAPLTYGATCPRMGIRVAHKARFPLGTLEVEVLHTPGHTPDSVCLHVDGALFTGDTLFTGKVGGTADLAAARQEYDSLHQALLTLPADTLVYPGHDYGTAPTSTIGEERRSNPFLLQPDFDAFFDLKRNWAAYKQAHGIT